MTDSPQQPLSDELRTALDRLSEGKLVIVSGAGISAQSGIPTFRGESGYWVAGSMHYRPEELATFSTFGKIPQHVWSWYIYRRGICRRADPNPAHVACVEIEKSLGNRLCLITQNVDGLHLRAGSSSDATYQIHGNINYMRCVEECSTSLYPVPESVELEQKDGSITKEEFKSLRCPKCDSPSRPHVLWFDEVYDEPLFRARSSMMAAENCSVLLVVGSSGSTNLPAQIAQRAGKRGATIIDINPVAGPFAREALKNGGLWLEGDAVHWLPIISTYIKNIQKES